MSDIWKPNLAGTPKSDADIPLPCWVSPKIDGVRAMVHEHGLMSRSMKPLPNKHIQSVLGTVRLMGLDGELVVGSATDPNCMQNTTSGVMAKDKTPDFTYYVFDDFLHGGPFEHRLSAVEQRVLSEIGLRSNPPPIVFLQHKFIRTLEELNDYEAEQLALGYEGVMVRRPDGLYKQGRSTPKEGGLLKIKRFVDGEFMIIGFEEQMKNNNAKVVNELGRSKRSSHKEGLTGKGTLGAFKAQHYDPASGEVGVEFSIGSGMDDAFRDWAWANQDKLLNEIGVYKSFPIGVLNAPRHPVFKALREKWDMS